MTGMMIWMVLFWTALIAGAVGLALAVSRGGRGGTGTPRAGWLIGGAIVAVGAVVATSAIVMAAGGFGMDGMGGTGAMHDMHGGRNTAGDPAVRADGDAAITIDDHAFVPGNLIIPAGASVTWTNRESVPHDATEANGAWKTARLSKGESDTLTFGGPGEYDYYCTIHPAMKARLIVSAG